MPRMDGIEMLLRARKVRPDLRVLLTSGLSRVPLGEAFLRKPYGLATATNMIVQMLKP